MSADLELLVEALGLKEVDRAGWKRVGIEAPESVADHSWGIALLVLALCPEDLDRERCLALAVLHDLAEVRVGDIMPGEMSREDKRDRERRAAAQLFRQHPRLWALWEDYEQRRSPEAQFVHQLDKLEMALQARRYGNRGDTAEFIDSARSAIVRPDLRALLAQLDEG